MLDNTTNDWWKSAVFYQFYPKSFQDTNGDGIGDIPGIIQHLDYLEKMGIDGIWLSPVYASPQRDNGYDISDYHGIHSPFGTKEDTLVTVGEAWSAGVEEAKLYANPDGFRGGQVLTANYADPSGPLRPYETRMLYVKA